MVMTVVTLLFGIALLAIALRANARFRGVDRLPMQWLSTGEVTWSAPRRVALAFIPVPAFLVLAGVTVVSLTVGSRPGQEGMVLPSLIGIGTVFVAVQLLHLWLVGKTLAGKTG